MLLLITVSILPVFSQRIETQKPDRNHITRLGTTQNHLSVIELSEPVTQVAAGSSSFKVEWRENKVFIQPLEPDAVTNLFIWTASGRLSYELVPAGSVEQMHFAIDQPPPPTQAKTVLVQPQREAPPLIPPEMLMESTPIKVLGAAKDRPKVEIILQDVYRKDERVYLRYAIVNGSKTVYVPGAPEVSTLRSPRTAQSLIPLTNSQLVRDYGLNWTDETRVPVIHTEFQTPALAPGQTAHGVTSFELSAVRQPGLRIVVRLVFPADAMGVVSAVLVL
ncbi:MAG: TrbG/VirB9 family P-type conjugative transfer protein [Bryobacteraceae bacterium]|nr:TrbG/VirB9 family P-type conjugative transfer protein [Bryobacteraceae bacterium]